VIFDFIVIALAAFVLFRDLSHKNAWINHTIPRVSGHCTYSVVVTMDNVTVKLPSGCRSKLGIQRSTFYVVVVSKYSNLAALGSHMHLRRIQPAVWSTGITYTDKRISMKHDPIRSILSKFWTETKQQGAKHKMGQALMSFVLWSSS